MRKTIIQDYNDKLEELIEPKRKDKEIKNQRILKRIKYENDKKVVSKYCFDKKQWL